ncbi:UxaA family hydrolase [Solitalea lacus]|uniref:UxaA family hydrolase n=1 Tax=Solitalea lacus TaxID=2911172 RepID=UPI001EDC6C1B|nr:altronate dehydratase family protein [Solitalea lacus]UKJ05868.1 altronate dehydratase family protein [Solitalea lacus]
MSNKVLHIHSTDNVLVALTDLLKDESVEFENEYYVLQNNIGAKHKFAMQDLSAGDEIIMYGVLVGKATQPILKGELIHTHNIKHASNENYKKQKDIHWNAPDVSKWQNKTFKGYLRSDGRVGTANYWLFVPTVFCENRNLDYIKDALLHQLGYAPSHKYRNTVSKLINLYKDDKNVSAVSAQELLREEDIIIHDRLFPNVDGIKFLNHEGGCGGTRQDSEMLSKLLAAYADHPNVAGVTILSLGCQHLQVDLLKQDIKKRNPAFDKPLFVFEQQSAVSEELMIAEAIQQTFTGLIEANKVVRTPQPLSKLCIGVKCGGSDGFSGISANPAVGVTSDLLVALGGQVLLAEFPELFGAEQELVDRCITYEAAEKFTRLMKAYDAQARAVGSGFYMNPSPGNIKDGLITDAIKSAGAAKKGGTAPVADVLDYTEPVIKSGLNLVCTPGNDVEATTGKAASGATLILFTTGLGTPTGNVICPTIKLSTNTTLANRMSDIIDIDCGGVITGEKSLLQMGEEILEYCIKAASGEILPKSVLLGQDDFIPWKRGVSL